MAKIELITTDDGSTSLFNPALNETYHSRHGAIAESNHVFIEEGLKYYINKHQPASISIFEVGFGTGLNALLTLTAAKTYAGIQFYYETIDTYPMPNEVLDSINYPVIVKDESGLFTQMHMAPFETEIPLTPNFTLFKVNNSLHTYIPTRVFNLVYFDAFAPEKQPDMWQTTIFDKLFSTMAPWAVMVTYCAQGQFRRNARSVGFTTERVPGPPFKREMTRVTKPLA